MRKTRLEGNVHERAALGSYLPLTRQTVIDFRSRHSIMNAFVPKERKID